MKLKGAIFPKKSFDIFSSSFDNIDKNQLFSITDFHAGIVPPKITGAFVKIFENIGDTLMWFFLVPYLIGIFQLFKKKKFLEPEQFFIIALVIPQNRVLGIFSLQGLTLLGLYLLGFGMAIVSGYLLHKILKVEGRSFFLIEMPDYKLPSVKNVFYTVVEKTKAFVFGAGKIILAISIILWFLASNGPSSFDSAEADFALSRDTEIEQAVGYNEALASYKLKHSYIGVMGKAIEPAIRPLGYDWKIGIALISSFAAREVFVGTLATIYSVGNDDDENTTIKQRMSEEINENTGRKLFNIPVGMSLLVFYAFAMQCVSTLAIVKRETNSWKWPLIQLVGMGLIAYFASFLTFTLLN